jgi:hypothetical protein
VCEATWAQIGIYGIWDMLPWQCLATKMLLTLAGLGILHFIYFLFFCKCNEIAYSNLLILENINFTFEYFSTKDVLNNLINLIMKCMINII